MRYFTWRFEEARQEDEAIYFEDGIEMSSDKVADTLNEQEKRIAELEAENAALKEERRWKDTNLELPKEDTEANALLVIYRHSGEWARTAFGLEYSDEFVNHFSHWMPLPEPPEVQQ